ncbi:MAG: hypothetical protein ACFFD4_16550 [Candidatus Odinarchaeota archaeon]
MSEAMKEFRLSLMKARVVKMLNEHLRQVERQAEERQTETLNNEDDSEVSEFDTNYTCGEILKQEFASTPKEIAKFRTLLARDLLPLMNALARTAVEKYAKKAGYSGKIPANTMHDRVWNNRSFREAYEMKYDMDEELKESPLKINSHLRHAYLHGGKIDRSKLVTGKSFEEILMQKVFIRFTGDRRVKFVKIVQGRSERIEVCKLLDSERFETPLASLQAYFAEFLLWRICNMIEEIDSNEEIR